MDHVQKASTHVRGRVAADGASDKGHSAIADVDTAALHLEKEMSEFNGAMEEGPRRFKTQARTEVASLSNKLQLMKFAEP